MLKVLFGKELDGVITSPSVYFDNMYEMDWFNDEIVKQMVRDIDKSELNGVAVLSPVLGSISVESLSGGVKGLILMYKLDDYVSDLISYGSNCEDWILRLSKEKDILVCMTGYDMSFKGKDIKALCLNDGTMIEDWQQWCAKMIEYGEDYYEG